VLIRHKIDKDLIVDKKYENLLNEFRIAQSNTMSSEEAQNKIIKMYNLLDDNDKKEIIDNYGLRETILNPQYSKNQSLSDYSNAFNRFKHLLEVKDIRPKVPTPPKIETPPPSPKKQTPPKIETPPKQQTPPQSPKQQQKPLPEVITIEDSPVKTGFINKIFYYKGKEINNFELKQILTFSFLSIQQFKILPENSKIMICEKFYSRPKKTSNTPDKK